MKKFSILLALLMQSVAQADIIETGKKLLPGTSEKGIFLSPVDEKKSKMEALAQERATYEHHAGDIMRELDELSLDLAAKSKKLAEQARTQPDNEFCNKELTISNDIVQEIGTLKQTTEQVISLIDQQYKLYADYVRDPNLYAYHKEIQFGEQSAYSFDDLQRIKRVETELNRRLESLTEQERSANIELENRKRTARASEEIYKKKKEELDNTNTKPVMAERAPTELSTIQRCQLLSLQERLYYVKKLLDEERIQENEYKISFIKAKIFTVKLKIDAVKDAFKKIKSSLRITEADVAYARDQLARKRQTLYVKFETNRQKIEQLDSEIKQREQDLSTLSRKYSIALGEDINDWSRVPKQTVTSYIALYEVARLNSLIQLLKRQKELQEAQKTLEVERLRNQEVQIDVQESFYNVVAQKFGSEEDIAAEIKKYDAARADTKANISKYGAKKNAAESMLEIEKKALDNIKKQRADLQEVADTFFKDAMPAYGKIVELLNSAEDRVKSEIDTLNKLINTDADIISVVTNNNAQIDFIVNELGSITVWHRPEYAISWEGVSTIIPNIKAFLQGIRSYLVHYDFMRLVNTFNQGFTRPNTLLYTILIILLTMLLCFASIRYGGVLAAHLLRMAKSGSFFALLLGFLGAAVGFTSRYAIGIGAWVCLFMLLRLWILPDPYIYIIFYLLSIPYLLMICHRFIRYFSAINVRSGYVLLGREFHRRFFGVFSTLLYATVTIQLFRLAFVLGTYKQSELPTILLALNFIILQISLIFLLTKEQILAVIPKNNEAWHYMRDLVDRYYHLILALVITVIVMSNPYVGFGRLLLYLLSKIVYTIILLRVLFWLHHHLKRVSAAWFFQTDEDVVRERFTHSKTLYGIFIIAALLAFLFIAAIVGAKIWRWPETLSHLDTFHDVIEWLKTPLIFEKTETPISAYTIAQLLFFIAMGFVLAFAVNRYVLGRVFDVLLVDAGVQNTISSITRYVIIMMSIVVGFQAVGLGNLVAVIIGALIVGIGWVIKDPVGDFVAYFIILVQRPIKIGDYIKIDNEVMGVVRKITPRAVVLRRKNSISIIIPNSKVMNHQIVNWNYAQGFIAFDDITLTIAFKEDPALVATLLKEVLDVHPRVLKNPKPIIRLNEFSEVGYVFMVRGYLSANYTLDQWDIASDIRLAIVKKLREHNMGIAIPVRISLRSDQLTAAYERELNVENITSGRNE